MPRLVKNYRKKLGEIENIKVQTDENNKFHLSGDFDDIDDLKNQELYFPGDIENIDDFKKIDEEKMKKSKDEKIEEFFSKESSDINEIPKEKIFKFEENDGQLSLRSFDGQKLFNVTEEYHIIDKIRNSALILIREENSRGGRKSRKKRYKSRKQIRKSYKCTKKSRSKKNKSRK